MKLLAVHLHLYYQDQLARLLPYLRNLHTIDHDLYITMVAADSFISQQILSEFPNAGIRIVANCGYDVGPFIDFLHQTDLNSYKYILKLHTKGDSLGNYTLLNNRRMSNSLWGRILWDSLLSTPQRLKSNLLLMEQDPSIGLLGSSYCLTDSPVDYQKMLPQINHHLAAMGFGHTNQLSFIAGTMFLAKAKLLLPLKKLKPTDFAPTDGRIKEGTLAHITERLFGAIITSQGSRICGIKHDCYGLKFLIPSIIRFFYQKKISKSGKTIIKICKIPVYNKNRG